MYFNDLGVNTQLLHFPLPHLLYLSPLLIHTWGLL